ncbi:SCO family protein [Pseudogemmobacter sonorensis]|uniref:SCO family protein n=1 Tax=Pseudogemmobacter sonorensis TaxID=2989681 RepID=UPI003686DBF0
MGRRPERPQPDRARPGHTGPGRAGSGPRSPGRLRGLRLLLWGGLATIGLGATWIFLGAAGGGPPTLPAAPLSQTQANATLGRGDYRLQTTDGESFTQDSLRGRPSLVFFGFTHCPDVCPTTMGEIALWQEALGPEASDLRIFFITVDPGRDTLAVLQGYTSWLPGATGVTGSPAEIDKALKSFRILARKVPLGGEDYTMDHNAYVMLFDREGRYSQIFSYQEDPDRVVAKLRRFFKEEGA